MSEPYYILCFSSAYWDEPLWTNKQHVMSRLAKRHCVLYVEPGLSVLGCIRGRKRLQHPWRRLFPRLRKVHEKLWLWYCPVLPGTGLPMISRINFRIQAYVLRALITFLNFRQPIAWVYRPEDVYLLDSLGVSLVCYDCVDEIAEFPVYADRQAKQRILAAEDRLLQQADIVFTTSPHLYETKRLRNPATYYVPNVADVEHFSQARDEQTRIPDEIATLPAPILGFVGAISAYKLDLDLLHYVAEAQPNWQIVLIGPIDEGERTDILNIIGRFPNVHLFGPRPYHSLPGYLKQFDVCLIPYALNQYTQGVFPMKFFEYMATGKPIISTALSALREFGTLIKLAESYEDVVMGVKQVLHYDSTRQERLIEVEKHTWEVRIQQMLTIIADR